MDMKKPVFYNMNSEELLVVGVSLAIGLALFVVNYLYIKTVAEGLIVTLVNILAVTVIAIPTGLIQYAKSQEMKDLEERFPDFARAVVEGIHGGMTLPLAIKYASRSSYGSLDGPIHRMIAKISWGVTFEEAMTDLARETNSKVIARAVSTIIEAHKSGGDIAAVMESVSQSTVAIEKIKRERQSKVSTQMVQGYIIYFIFIGIMIGLQQFLIPALSFGSFSGESVSGLTDTSVFLHLAVLQGLFAGLAIGKLAEGRISSGIKHSLILSIVGFAALSLSAI